GWLAARRPSLLRPGAVPAARRRAGYFLGVERYSAIAHTAMSPAEAAGSACPLSASTFTTSTSPSITLAMARYPVFSEPHSACAGASAGGVSSTTWRSSTCLRGSIIIASANRDWALKRSSPLTSATRSVVNFAPLAPTISPSAMVTAPVADSAARSTGALGGSCWGMAGGAGAVLDCGCPVGAEAGPPPEQPATSTADAANSDSARRLPKVEQGMDLDPRERDGMRLVILGV